MNTSGKIQVDKHLKSSCGATALSTVDGNFVVAVNVMPERAQQIVEAVNEYDNLVAKVKELQERCNRQRKSNAATNANYKKLAKEKKQFSDVLKRCSPFEVDDHGSYTTEWCIFCHNEREIGHAKLCEYAAFIKETTND